jgi:multisubunit Na+/H+ antiporter MnhB subunit
MSKKQIIVFTLGVILSVYMAILLHLNEIKDIGVVNDDGYMPIKHMVDALLAGSIISLVVVSILMVITSTITFGILNDD